MQNVTRTADPPAINSIRRSWISFPCCQIMGRRTASAGRSSSQVRMLSNPKTSQHREKIAAGHHVNLSIVDRSCRRNVRGSTCAGKDTNQGLPSYRICHRACRMDNRQRGCWSLEDASSS